MAAHWAEIPLVHLPGTIHKKVHGKFYFVHANTTGIG